MAAKPAIALRTPREIANMRAAGKLVAEALELAAALVAPGVSTRQLDQAIEQMFAARRALPLFKNYPHPHGRAPFPAVSCISVNEQIVHGIPGDRPLRGGDIVSIDTGCKLGGWCGDAAVTLAVGEIPPEVRHLLEVTRGTLNLAIELMGRQQWWSEIAAQLQAFVQDSGCTMIENFVGHGIGRTLHEHPPVPTFVNASPQEDFRLEPGLVIAIEPIVTLGAKEVSQLPDDWTIVTQDGRPSAHFEHTVAMTPSGPIALTAPGE